VKSFAERIGLRDSAERGAFFGVLVAVVVVLLAGLFFGLKRGDHELGSNAVGVGTPVATVLKGQRLCINKVDVPEHTARLNVWLAAKPEVAKTTFDIEFVGPNGAKAVAADQPVTKKLGYQLVNAPKTPFPVEQTKAICLVGKDSQVQVGGAQLNRYPGSTPATLDGKSLDVNEPSVHYYSAASDQPRELSKVVAVFAHSAAFHGPLYPWLMLLTLLLALAASAYALRILITADRHSIKRIATVFTLACFCWCLSWSVMSPPFQGNDETEHFANLEYTATTGKGENTSYKNTLPTYSTHENLLMLAVHHNAVVVDGTARPFWNDENAPGLDRDGDRAKRSNGGGFSISTSGHGPLYYALFAPFYQVSKWMQPANQLVFLRAVNSVFASLVALFAVLTAALLLGDRRKLAAAVAGALVAFQPMYAYVSGAINNDTIASVTGAALLYLLVRLAREGWTRKTEIWIGVLAVVGVLGKITGVSNAVFAAMVVALTMLRDRTGSALRGGLTVLATVIATSATWLMLTTVIGWPRMLAYQHTDIPPTPDAWHPTMPQRIDYIIQQVFPFIHLTGPMVQVSHAFERVYVVGGFGDFFWHRAAFPIPVFKVILLVLLVVFAAGAVGIVRYRRWALKNWLPALIVLAQPVVVYVFVESAYAVPGGRTVMAEQGRYIFPALAALAVIAAGAGFGLPKKLREFAWGGLAGLIGAFTVVAWFFAAYHVYA
jgi:hypothetical protein